MLSEEATNTNFIVFGLIRPGPEPTIFRTRGEHADHYATDAVVSLRESITDYMTKVILHFKGFVDFATNSFYFVKKNLFLSNIRASRLIKSVWNVLKVVMYDHIDYVGELYKLQLQNVAVENHYLK